MKAQAGMKGPKPARACADQRRGAGRSAAARGRATARARLARAARRRLVAGAPPRPCARC